VNKHLKNLLVLVILFVVYYAIAAFLHRDTYCLIKNTTGFPCPGCGMTRSYVSLLHGDVQGAFYYHPLFWTVPVTILLAYLMQGSKVTVKTKKRMSYCLAGLVIVFALVYILRMIWLFPNHEPMTFYKEAILPSILRTIRNSVMRLLY